MDIGCANITLGEKQKVAEAKARKSDERIAELEAQLDKLNGELKARRRKIHGKNSEKRSGDKSGKKKARPRMRATYLQISNDLSKLCNGAE